MSETIAMPPLDSPETKQIPTVYFIDDSATMREVIKIAFRRESINVITCADAASALAQFEQSRPDVVITDVIMPKVNGLVLAQRLLQERPGIGVLYMSGCVEKSILLSKYPESILLQKPFTPDALIAAVRQLLASKEQQ